jgi:small conductance mechanosensitive channel
MKKNKTGIIIKWVLFALLVAATVVITLFNKEIFGFKKVIGIVEGVEKWEWDPQPLFHATSTNAILQYVIRDLPLHLLKSIQIVGFAVTLAVALHYLAKVSFHTKRGVTIAKLIVSFLKWATALVALFFILDEWGVPATATLAGIGVVTLIIGLGSQSLVADILAGIFIVFEGEYEVGDIVIIDGWRGTVQQIGIRTTRLIDAGGNIKIVNNNEIKSIVNQTKELSLAKVYFPCDYETPVERVESIIADHLDAIKEKIPAIIEGPFYKGISDFGASNINYFFIAKCDENDIYQVQRDLNRELRIMFFKEGVDISYDRVVVQKAEQKQENVSVKEHKKAEKFVEEQKELSKELEDRNDY